ncbi:MAG: hypothetical protein JW893_04790 [Candidatus Omnitrophica bacterium]|nr:hypothetical protein [Candidatus Omnitrophota bacterium]
MNKKNNDENEINSNCLYFDFTQEERDSAIRYLLGLIIKSRNEGNFPSNYYTYDEDVNIYLAHLLFAVSLPEYQEMAEPYLSLDTSDVLNWVRNTEDRTIRYFIFKVNADHLLIHSAVFNDLNGQKRPKMFKRSPKHFQELAKLYYEQAASYHRRIYRKKTGVGDVLQKLAQYFESYQAVLSVVRRDYFNFMNQFRDHVFKSFTKELNQYEAGLEKKIKMDRFLDLYGKWLEDKSPILEKEIVELALQLKRIDPEFKFDIQKYFHRGGGFSNDRQCA